MTRSAVVQTMLALLVLVAFDGTCAAAPPPDQGILVTSVQGDVRITVDGRTHELKRGSIIKPPATIRTGRDSAVELRQGGTRASVAADTQMQIPALPLRGKFVEHVVQPRGNVFYDVAPRSGSKLRVETPYLVAVIKGTQFNVASHPDSATVSLFEGRLEIWTPDGSDVVQLNAGEIATRGANDARIRVLLMATGETLRASTGTFDDGGARNDGFGGRDAGADLATTVDSVRDRSPLSPVGELENDLAIDASLGTTSDELIGAKIDLGTGTDGLETTTSAELDLGVADAGATLDAGLDLGSGSADLGASLDASAAGVDAALDTSAGADLSAGTVDLGAEAVLADTSAGLDAGVDLGSSSIDASVELGDIEADLGTDLETGSLDTTLETEPDLIEETVEDVVAPLGGLLGN